MFLTNFSPVRHRILKKTVRQTSIFPFHNHFHSLTAFIFFSNILCISSITQTPTHSSMADINCNDKYSVWPVSKKILLILV